MPQSAKTTAKERSVLKLLLEGCQNREIGERLGITERTVKSHLGHVFRRRHISGGCRRVKLARLLLASVAVAAGQCPHLRPRYLRVLELVAQGLMNQEIAELTGTTEHVVKNYCRDLYDQTGMSNRVELTGWYLAHKQQLAPSPR